MTKPNPIRFLLLLLAVMAVGIPAGLIVSAQPISGADLYYIAANSGAPQVWRLPADGISPAVVTQAPSGVVDFAVTADGAQIAYTSGGYLWLQNTANGQPMQLIGINSSRGARPVFSPDGTLLAFVDGGVWVMGTDGSDPRMIVRSVELDATASNMGDIRVYEPYAFTRDGRALIVSIAVWEGVTVGIADLESGELQEVERDVHHRLLELADGRLLVYGNGGVAGEFDVQIASRADITNRQTVFDLLTFDIDVPLFVDQAVEIAPGIVRLIGMTISSPNEGAYTQAFAFDLDVNSGSVRGDLRTFDLGSTDPMANMTLERIAPDGRALPHLVDVEYRQDLDEIGIAYGRVFITDLESGAITPLANTDRGAWLRWTDAD
jgi:hypothetical protein